MEGAVIYKNLSVRQYMALFSVSDYFCGGTSGGAHLAAAFDKPALIVVWEELSKTMRFPFTGYGCATNSFLYPQHNFIVGQKLTGNNLDMSLLEHLVKRTIAGAIDQDRIVEFSKPISKSKPIRPPIRYRH